MARATSTERADRSLIDGYLSEMANDLVASAATRATVINEISDGLLESVASHRERGLPEAEAARAAIAEFGAPGMIAAAFQQELGARQARRSALVLMTSGPIVGIAWLTGVVLSSLPPARHHLIGPWWGLPFVGVAIVVGIPGLIVTIVATGRMGLRLTLPPGLPTKAMSIASAAAVATDATMLTIAALYLAMTSASALFPLAPAIVASLIRICLASRVFWGHRRTAALT
jgi:hypothetical protein